MTGGIVKIGTWYDYEEGGVWGWNFTVNSQQATLITALLALGLQTTGLRSWKIFRYILHHGRRHDLPRDAMIREQEVLLRNEGSDIGAVFGMASLLSTWRTFGSLAPGDILKSSRRSSWKILGIGLIHWLCFLILATWLPLVLSKGKPNALVLMEDMKCLLLDSKSGIFESNIPLISKEMPKRTAAGVAKWYYDTCYRDGGYAVDCNRFSKRKISWSEHRQGLKCPFLQDTCVENTQPISFDTGHLSPLVFGKNTEEAIDITIRRRTTCSPVKPDIFATVPPNPVQGYHYFNFSVESNPTVSLLTGGTPLNIRIGRSSRDDYEVVAVARSGPYRTNAMKDPYIHPALNRSDAEVVIVVINKEGVRYRAAVDDVVFAAHVTQKKFLNVSGLWYNKPEDNGYTPDDLSLDRNGREYDSWYYADEPVSMIGCADQMEICHVSSNECSGLVSVPSSAISLMNLFPTLIQFQTFFGSFSSDTGAGFIVDSNIVSGMREFGPEALDVRRYSLGFGDGKQNAPRNGLWENEARSWFGAAIAGMQFSVVQNTAMSLLPEKRKDYKGAIKAVKGYRPSGKNCWSVKVRSSEHETLSLFGILLLISICAIIFGISSLDGLMQRARFRDRPHQVLAWELDAAQQLVRQLHHLIKPVIVHPTILDAPPTAVGTTGIPSLKKENGSHWIANYALTRDSDVNSSSQPTLNNIAKTMTGKTPPFPLSPIYQPVNNTRS
ncbi:hypothetical protein FBEOM_6205 [Fusarium beomiforme]|uniref:Uncharacterized protein n=1 Tax=Fusarium beomiforme TaxID=44412 RepID=A0A9P5AL92_9HYPO|nr:hypothetical protein FBEOM_6205 [Fusarium beomiforme]